MLKDATVDVNADVGLLDSRDRRVLELVRRTLQQMRSVRATGELNFRFELKDGGVVRKYIRLETLEQ